MTNQEFTAPIPNPESEAPVQSTPVLPPQQSVPVHTQPYPRSVSPYVPQDGSGPTYAPPAVERSYFDGGTLQLIGWRLLGFLLTVITLGIGSAWAQCMIYRWQAKHTVIDGKRLVFTGKGLQLLGKWLLWGFLTLITLGIFAIFIPVKQQKWYTSHLTSAENASKQGYRESGGIGAGGIVLIVIGAILAVCLAAGAFLLLRGVPAADQPAQTENNAYALGRQAHLRGDYDLAIRYYSTAIDGSMLDPDPYLSLAQLYLDMDDPDKALDTLYQGRYQCPGCEDLFDREILVLESAIRGPEETHRQEQTQQPDNTTWQETPVQIYYVHVSSGGLNLRSQPHTSGEMLILIPQGARLEITAWENGWAKTSYGGYTGWCSGDYLRDYPYTPPETQDPQGPGSSSGGEKPSGYTLAKLEQAKADTKKYAQGYFGKTPDRGKTSMSAQGAIDFYKEIMDGYLEYSYQGRIHLIDMPSEWRDAYNYELTDLTVDEVCNYYFSLYTDDTALQRIASRWVFLDGNVYHYIPGYGDEGLYTQFDFTVDTQADGYYVTMHVRNYRGENNEIVESWEVTHRCFLEDGIWVFDGFTTPYV